MSIRVLVHELQQIDTDQFWQMCYEQISYKKRKSVQDKVAMGRNPVGGVLESHGRMEEIEFSCFYEVWMEERTSTK